LLVIPECLQDKVVKLAHEAHQGETKTIALLKQSVWFPGMAKIVKRICSQCTACQLAQQRLVERPILMRDIPEDSLRDIHDGSLASGSGDNTILIWDMKTGQSTKVLNGHSDSVTSLAVLQDGSLASGSSDKSILIWDTKTGQSTKVLIGHSHFVLSLAVLQDGSLASGSSDKSIQ